MENLQPLKYLIVPSKVKHTATVVFLHGLGGTGESWEPVAKMLQRDPALGHVKWILPHARVNPVTMNFGEEMPSWFDKYTRDHVTTGLEDEKGMLASSNSINEIITAEVDAGTDVSRIVLGGFSQGGAMTLLTGLTTEHKLAGLVALSSYLPLRHKMKSMLSNHAKTLPIFMGHGTADRVVTFKFGQGSAQYLKTELGFSTVESGKVAGVGIRFEQYEGLDHNPDPAELDHLSEWLNAVIPGEKE